MNMTARVLLGLALVVAAISVWDSEWARLRTGRWSFTQSVSTDTGTYFRLQVRVAYKDEPVDFDIVVGCNVRRTGYKDGSSSVEVGMVPVVFGKRMPDNKGLVVRAPDACGGRYIKEGWIADDLLPVMVVYDDADTLAFGTAYMSEDAYESPLSVLRFGWATITTATRQEFDAFRKEQTNLVGRNAFHSARMGPELLRSRGLELAVPFGSTCHTYHRFRIPEALREQVRRSWPSDRPRYWWPGYTPTFTLLDKLQRDVGEESRRLDEWIGSSTPEGGIGRAHGGGRIRAPALAGLARPAPSFFPLFSDIRAGEWPLKMEEWPAFMKRKTPFIGERIDFQNGDMRGFAYCYRIQYADSEKLTADQRNIIIVSQASAAAIRLVDRDKITNAPTSMSSNLNLFIENDEFIFRKTSIFLEGTGSDV